MGLARFDPGSPLTRQNPLHGAPSKAVEPALTIVTMTQNPLRGAHGIELLESSPADSDVSKPNMPLRRAVTTHAMTAKREQLFKVRCTQYPIVKCGVDVGDVGFGGDVGDSVGVGRVAKHF